MKAYIVYYQVEGKKWSNNFLVDAKDRESAIRKTKRKIAKEWRISEDEITIKSVGVIGYY